MATNNLKKIRKSKNLLQKDVANFLNIAVSTYSYWENGTYDIDNDSLNKLADYFNISTDYILGREDDNIIHIPENLKDANISLSVDIKKLTQEEINEISNYIDFIKQRKRNKEEI